MAGRFTGHALVAPAPPEQPGEWCYTEHGELRFAAHTGPASRQLRYQGLPDGTVAVRFADGRPFYVLDLRTGQAQAEHGCGRDHYLLSHRVLAAGLLEEEWRVRGPDKDYLAITRLTRKPLHDAPILSHHGRQQRDISHARAPARGWWPGGGAWPNSRRETTQWRTPAPHPGAPAPGC